MKRAVIVFTCIVVGVVFLVGQRLSTLPAPLQQSNNETHVVESTPSLAPAIPTRVIVSSLGIDAAVESVGLDDEGNMDVPKAPENVGWYSLGYKPGEGSVVVAGHLDTKTGAPAVFFNLHSIHVGETIEVVDKTNAHRIYRVEDVKTYPYDGLPLQELFTSQEQLLRLITCNGVFDSNAKNYSNRLVVTARLYSLK